VIAGVGRIKAQFHDVNCDIDDVFCNAQAGADLFKAGQWASAPFLQDRSKSLQTFPALSFKGFCGIFDGIIHAVGVGDSLSCNVNGRTVVNRGAQIRQVHLDIHAADRSPFSGGRIDFEGKQLDRDMPLVVKHGERCIILSGPQLDEYRVAPRNGPAISWPP